MSVGVQEQPEQPWQAARWRQGGGVASAESNAEVAAAAVESDQGSCDCHVEAASSAMAVAGMAGGGVSMAWRLCSTLPRCKLLANGAD